MDETVVEDSKFSIKTEVFEGPLELLIDLIEKRKLLVNDISLAEVTDEYMAHVAALEQNPLRETTDFVHLASTLLLIKSRSLLPVLELTESEEEDIDDLEERLKLYQVYHSVGKNLAHIFGQTPLYSRSGREDATPIFLPDKYTETSALRAAMTAVFERLPKVEVKPKVHVKQTVSLEHMIDRLKTRIEQQMKCMLSDLTGGSTEPATVIVGFLAVLEMVKQGSVAVTQGKRFENIAIEREATDTPRYI